MEEPTHDLSVRSTATSESEGRLKSSFLTRKKKKSIVKKVINKKV